MSRSAALALVAGLLALITAAVVLYGAYLIFPSFLERSVSERVQEEFALESAPRVELELGSPSEILAGRFTGGRVTMRDVELGGIRAEEVVVDLAPVDLDLLGSVLSGRIESEEPVSGTLTGVLSEDEVLRVVRANADVPVRGLELEDGGAVVESETPVFGLTVPVSLRGELSLRGEDLVFEPRQVSALGTELPPEVAEGALSGTDLSYPLDGLPSGAEISGVEVQEGRLILTAEMRPIPLG